MSQYSSFGLVAIDKRTLQLKLMRGEIAVAE